jgi:uncharacterized hydantoinase/oxoprolinase family protein
MKKFFAVSALFAISAMAETMTGVISDEHCGAKHADASGAACIKSCVKQGAAVVFVSDGKVYKIADSSKDKVANHLGEKVKVDGNFEGDTVTIDSITAESGS